MTITIADGRGALWQWDTGRRIRVDDSSVKQVHYQNRVLGCSVDVDVEDDGTAIIPDELLQDYHRLTAYAYATDDTGAYTMVQQDFAVYRRAKPSGYVYTPTDQMTLQTIQRQIGDLANLTTEAKDTLVAAINEAARSGGGAGSMDLRVADGYIQYSNDGSKTWENLIAVADLKGADGAKGDKGDTGAPGQQGPQGESGVKGSDGVTPTIGENGDWYIGDTDTGKPSRGEKGEKGEPGSDGAPGVPGAPGTAATISVGKVTTGAAGTGASVSNSGSSTAAVFDFTIPRGAKGEKGDKGEQGAPGNPGAPGAAGQDGHSPVVTASKTGKTTTISVDETAVATVVDGADGAPGKDGSPGAKGDKGETGPQGPKGDPGAAGTPGKDGAGMDITGATVGQIAKITAVDASGVPTAWSPADMPSGGSTDAVLYTPQTLTEAQKKQARENVDAADADFVVNGTVNSDMTVTLDKTFKQIKAAIQSGKQPVAKLSASGSTALLPFVGNNKTTVAFMSGVSADESFISFNYLTITSAGTIRFAMKNAAAISDSGIMQQVHMAFNPISDMQIATKKYVDDALAAIADGTEVSY